jgi:fructose transport system permease protein
MTESRSQPSQDFEKGLSGSSTTVASFERHHRSPLERVQHVLHSNPALTPLIVLVLSLLVFGVTLGTKFFSPFALTLILQQVSIVGIVGAAQTLVVLTAGIDLSVGAIMVISSVVMGQFTFRYGIPAPISILCGFAVGGAIGFVNGFLVARVKLPPFIVTLGMWQIVLAANFLYSRNETIRSQDIDAEAPLLHLFGASIRVGGAVLTYRRSGRPPLGSSAPPRTRTGDSWPGSPPSAPPPVARRSRADRGRGWPPIPCARTARAVSPARPPASRSTQRAGPGADDGRRP